MTNIYNQDFKKPLDKKFLYHQYIELNKTLVQIMKEFNLSRKKIVLRLNVLGIKKTKELLYKNKNVGPELKTKEALEKMYFDDGLSIVQIADKLRCHYNSVIKLFNSRGIEINKKWRYERRRNNYKLRSKRQVAKRNIKMGIKESNRKTPFRSTVPCSKEKKLILSEKAVERNIKENERSEAEKKTREILNRLIGEKNVAEQVGLKVINNNLYHTGFVVDFLLNIKNQKCIVVLEVDSEYYHIIPSIVEKDKRENHELTNEGFIVVRLWSNQISEENVKKCLEVIQKLNRPSLVKIIDNKVVVEYLKPETRDSYCIILFYNPELDSVEGRCHRFNFNLGLAKQ